MTDEDVEIEFDRPEVDVVVWIGTPEEVRDAFARIDEHTSVMAQALAAYSDGFAAIIEDLVVLSDGFKQKKESL